jgi:metal-sulfur cluster biosynthetic enzyme
VVSEAQVMEELRSILDPELNINIVDLGLVYDLQISGEEILVDFTLTYPGCPIGPQLQEEIEGTLRDLTGVEKVRATLVWEPVWGPERMSEAARLELGYPI